MRISLENLDVKRHMGVSTSAGLWRMIKMSQRCKKGYMREVNAVDVACVSACVRASVRA